MLYKSTYKFFSVIMIVMLGLAMTPVTPAYAAACTFTSNATGTWTTAGTWSAVGTGCSTYPGETFAGDIVIVSAAHTVTLDVSPANSIASLTVNGTFNMNGVANTNRTLTVTGNVVINSTAGLVQPNNQTGTNTHTLNIGGDFTNNDTFTSLATDDVINVVLNGGAAQAIGGTSATTFENLTLSPTVAATISASTNFNLNGTFTVNANATFIPAAAVQLTAGSTNTITGSGTIHVTRVDGSNAYASQYDFDTNTLTNLTVNFSASGNQEIDGRTYGSLVTSGSGTKTQGNNVTVNNSLTIGSGTALTIGNNNLTVTGTTSISGTLNINNTGGTKTFVGNVTINSGGTWNNSVIENVTFRGGLTNNGTFTAGTGIQTFDTNDQSIGGTNAISIPNLTVTGVGITLTNNGTLTTTVSLAGTGELLNGATGILNIDFPGVVGITTLTANTAGNTVNYSDAAAQTVRAIAYSNLTLSGGGLKTLPTGTSVTGTMNIIPSAVASIANGVSIPVNALSLNSVGQINGSWGATTSPATNQNNTYFNNALNPSGILNVATNTAPNTAPTVQAVITDVTVNEDAANTVFSLYPNFQDTESADNLLTYTVTAISNTALFTSPTGALPIAIADPTNFTLDYAPNVNGVSNITIRATDPGGLFVEDTFQVTVNSVNDEPSFTAANPLAVNEDAGAQSVPGWVTAFNPGGGTDESAQTATYSVTNAGSCATLLSAGPAVSSIGTLTYTPAANANGTCTFDVAVQDNGGVANGGDDTSPTQNFTITVNVVNDEPSFGVSGAIPAVNEDAGAVSVPGWIVLFNRGGGPDELSQTALNWIVSNSTCGTLLSTGPSVAGNTLSYTTAANANGTCTFDLQVQDNGGTANGGDDTSAAGNYTITVNAVNDEPSFTAANPPAVGEDAGAQTVNAWATFDPGNTSEAGQTATYSVTNSTCGTLLSAGPAVNASGDLTYTPAANQNGTCTFDVSVQDNGGTANGGDDTSGTQNFTITINAVNDNPTGGNDSVTTLEDTTYTFLTTDFTYNDEEGSPFAGIRVTTLESTGTLQCGGVDLNLNDSCADVTTLTFAPVADENGAAYATFQFEVFDGSLFSTSSYTMTINVTAVNDEPSFTAANPPAVGEDAGAQTVNAWATFDPGNTSEAGQTATYSVTNSTCGTLLSAGPAVNASGDLTYTPAANQNGTCTFDVSVQDNGGTANGGDDTSGTQNFTITVNAANDAPAETVTPDQFRTDGTTVIPQGGLTNETSVVFKATATDTESDQYTLEVEAVDNAAAFTNTATCTSPLTNSGTEASTGSCGPFAAGSYKWQYRFVDSGSAASAWTAFAGSDPDFIIDNGSPTVTNVTSTDADGTYFAGDTITILVTFSENVNVTGTPQLLLELGAVDGLANYVSGSGTNTLTFTYTIVTGDNTLDLDYVANNSLTLNGGSIQDSALNNANLTLPNPGAANSLGANKDIVIDALILVVVNNGMGSIPDTGDGSISENEQVANTLNITQLVVRFNKNVRDVPASTTDPDEVDNPANYILVRSNTIPVGNFNTISCAGGVVAPDIQTLVTSVTYSNGGGSGPFEATLTLSAPLATNGYYRLYVCGTTSIVQANNITLALAGNGTTAGTDFVRNFQIITPSTGGGGDDDGDDTNGSRNASSLAALNVSALPATGFAPNRVTVLPEQPEELAYSNLGDLWVEIPALGVKSSIVGVPQVEEGEWDVKWLGNNVGWLNGTAFPSWEGNSVITAHVTNASGLEGPFSNLKKLKYGDQIIVHAFGDKYIFEVRNSRLTRPFSTSFAFEDLEDQSFLTLITCQVYLPTSDTYMFRRVVRAVLVSVESE